MRAIWAHDAYCLACLMDHSLSWSTLLPFLAQLRRCRSASHARTGTQTAGSAVRRKKKAVHKVSTTDDKRLQATLKRLGVNTIPGIEEVNLFQDNDVIHFTNPKGQCCSMRLRTPCRHLCSKLYGSTALLDPDAAYACLCLRAVQASIAANTFVVSGPSQTRSASSMPPLH